MATRHLAEETGEISTDKAPYMYVEWKVPENIVLPLYTEHRIHSPSFHFKDATWNLCLIIHPKISAFYNPSQVPIDVYLVKTYSSALTLRIICNSGIKTLSGGTYNIYRGENTSKSEGDSVYFKVFGLRTFELRQNSGLSSNGIATFFCYFSVETAGNLVTHFTKKPFDGQSKKETRQHVTENTGEISTGTSLLTYVEWKVPDNLLLSRVPKRTIPSPSFLFKDGTWYLQMIICDPEFNAHYGKVGNVTLHLVKKECAAPKCHVDCKVGIKSVDGNLCQPFQSGQDFHRNPPLLIWQDSLVILAKEGILTPLTICCYFWPENSECLDAVLTTKMTEGLTGEKPRVLTSTSTCTPKKPQLSSDYTAESTATLTSSAVSSVSTLSCTSEKPQLSSGLDKLGTDFKNLFMNGENSDVTIKVKNKEFKAHKCILCARSTVFRSMFTHDMAEKNNGTVDIVDCDPDAFEIFLFYLYSGKTENVSANTVFDLYGAADKYDAEEVKFKCKEFMLSSLTIDTVCDVIEHALQYNEAELLKIATDFFAKNFRNIILTVKWQSFLKKNTVAANELLIKFSNYYALKE